MSGACVLVFVGFASFAQAWGYEVARIVVPAGRGEQQAVEAGRPRNGLPARGTWRRVALIENIRANKHNFLHMTSSDASYPFCPMQEVPVLGNAIGRFGRREARRGS